MSGGLPPQDLECPDPAGCPVAVAEFEAMAAAGRLAMTRFPDRRHWSRVYDAVDGYGQANPGFGDTRFAPFDAAETGARVPTVYLAESLEAALLETALHDVSETRPRVVVERTLLGKHHARVVPPRDLQLVDLRDDQLTSLQLDREHVVSSPAEHYPCTRRVARAIHASPAAVRGRADGIIWHSRQAEITTLPAQEVLVVFADRVPDARGAWQLAQQRDASGALMEGSGRLRMDELAESLDVTIAVSGDLDS